MTKLSDLKWCIAKPGSYGVWNLYATGQEAIDALVNLKTERPGEYDNALVLLFDDWNSAREADLLSPGLQEITEEAYWYALEVLPPMQWHTGDGVNRFCMSEFTAGNITNQYATLTRNGERRYFCKPVSYNDRATYITAALIEAFDAERRQRVMATATNRPGDEAAAYAEETGCDYATALVRCNMD